MRFEVTAARCDQLADRPACSCSLLTACVPALRCCSAAAAAGAAAAAPMRARTAALQAVLADCTEPTDVDRKFVISYYIRDFTLAVYEPPMRNSGVIGGQFLKRQR